MPSARTETSLNRVSRFCRNYGYFVSACERLGTSLFIESAASITPCFMEHESSSSPTRGHRALAAIVMSDGVGFSARMMDDEEHTLRLIHRDLQLMREMCQQFEGQVLKSTGDGLLMYFISAVQAVSCAVEMQKALAQAASHLKANDVLMHRIGIHLGDVFLSETDVMGNGVNIAARLQAEAEPQGICISQTVYDVVKSRLTLNATYAGPLKLKNIQEAVPAYQLSLTLSDHPAQANVRPEEAEVAVGTLINDRYRVQQVLGRGGFGRTYLAADAQRFDDRCVLKEFLPLNKTDYIVKKSRDLFEREARALYQINHPQIPKFLAWFTQKGRLFIVQEYIDGKTFATLLKERQHQGLLFTEAEVVQWLQDLLPVLDYLHGLNIVHRDISPDNMMLPTGRVAGQATGQVMGRSQPMLIDFGLVKQTVAEMWQADGEQRLPHSGPASFVGKLGYAPPEQIRMGQCYPCSDLYALGVTAVVLLTGKDPNALMDQGSLEWQWHRHMAVNPSLAQVLHRMLADKPNRRYQSAQEVMADLRTLVADASLTASPMVLPYLPSEVSGGGVVGYDQGRSPVPGSPSVSSGPIPSAITVAFAEVCRQELARCIGPMANCIVEDMLADYPEMAPQQLVAALAAEIPNSQQANLFTAHITAHLQQAIAAPSPAPSPAQPASPSHLSGPSAVSQAQSAAPHPAPPVSQPTGLPPALIERCQRELAQCIGPMAQLVMEDVLAQADYLSPQQFVQAIAAEIPNPQQAQAFQQHLLEYLA